MYTDFEHVIILRPKIMRHTTYLEDTTIKIAVTIFNNQKYKLIDRQTQYTSDFLNCM